MVRSNAPRNRSLDRALTMTAQSAVAFADALNTTTIQLYANEIFPGIKNLSLRSRAVNGSDTSSVAHIGEWRGVSIEFTSIDGAVYAHAVTSCKRCSRYSYLYMRNEALRLQCITDLDRICFSSDTITDMCAHCLSVENAALVA